MGTLPPLNALWRPNDVGPAPKTRDDRELIRSYSNQAAYGGVYHDLTVTMNVVATASPSAVKQIQTWINEIETLETQYAEQVEAGTAHYGQAEEYEGPLPGQALSRDDLLKRADVLEWDTTLNRVRIKAGSGATATAGGAIGQRIAQLKGRVLAALDLQRMGPGRLLRG